MPAPKKHPSVRARTNRATTAKTVTADGAKRVVPPLPEHPSEAWHPQTIRWWNEIWNSPLPDTWQSFDLGSVFTLALSYNDIWLAVSASGRKEALSEYRLQRKDFFIAPYNRLQGEIVIETADEAKARGAQRRAGQSTGVKQPAKGSDPRRLFAVS